MTEQEQHVNVKETHATEKGTSRKKQKNCLESQGLRVYIEKSF